MFITTTHQISTMKLKPSPPPPFLLLLLISAVLRHLSVATSPFPNKALPTKSGYLSVNSTTGSAIFYAYYESKTHHNNQTPILLWLQGGPGCSSMLANFFELGPWLIAQDLSLKPNPYSWNKLFGLLFLDNPIGTGFSIAASTDEIPRNQDDVAKHLLTAIDKFVALDDSFPTRPIYITGESYAGKYIPSLGHYILKNNNAQINLAGVAIGNGMTDPVTQVSTIASNCYNLGLVNQKQKAHLEKLQDKVIRLARDEKWNESANARNDILGALFDMTGLATLYDFRRRSVYPERVVAKFLNGTAAKGAMGVKKSMHFKLCSDEVRAALHEDVMRGVRDKVEFLVGKGIKVLVYEGQCDLRDSVVSTEAWVEKMKWDGFMKAKRSVWKAGEELIGYVQKYMNFSHVVVLNAGHLVPYDQPLNAQVMMQDWVLGKGMFA